jgi:hypothetical protein
MPDTPIEALFCILALGVVGVIFLLGLSAFLDHIDRTKGDSQ